MARRFLTPIDMSELEIQNFLLPSLPSDPDPIAARIYFNSGSGKIRFYNGTAWVELEDSGSVSGVASLTANAPLSVNQSTGTVSLSISAATTSAAGTMSSDDKTKLDGATAANTNGRLVIRDVSGNFAAGTITATLDGSASQLDGQAPSWYLSRANHTGTQTASTISDLASVVKAYRLDEFAAPTSNLNVNNQKITGLAEPTSASDAATKGYVDASRAGLDAKESVRAATTGNITLSGTQTIDGVALTAGDRVLVKNQTDKKANGIYIVASGAWSRADDADQSDKVTSGMFTFVEEGTDNDNTGWVLSTPNPIVLGTTELEFVQFSGAGSIEAGNGLQKAGETLSVLGTANRISVGATVDIASTYAGQASITTLGTITSGTWDADTIAVNKGGTGATSHTSGNFLIGAGTSAVTSLSPADARNTIEAVHRNAAITGATKTKITYDAKGLVTAGADLVATDIPNLPASKITTGTIDLARIPAITVAKGGTGLATVPVDSFLKGNGTNALVPRTYAQVKTDLSLNNVENVALSTWGGSSNITTVGDITSGTWSGTTIALNRGGTGATTAAAARANLGAVGKFSMDIGDNSAVSFAANHNFGTRDVTVNVYEKASPYAQVECTVEHTTDNQVTLKFATAPATGEFRAVVTG